MTYEEFTDPRLVALYDTVCPYAADTEFFIGLAGRLAAGPIVDVGCGTGLLTVELARRGHQVAGLDPAPQMLAVARRRPGGQLARWVTGYPDALAAGQASLVLMTGHDPVPHPGRAEPVAGRRRVRDRAGLRRLGRPPARPGHPRADHRGRPRRVVRQATRPRCRRCQRRRPQWGHSRCGSPRAVGIGALAGGAWAPGSPGSSRARSSLTERSRWPMPKATLST